MRSSAGNQREAVRFEVYTDYSGRFRWRLRARDLLVIADSAHSFDSPEAAAHAARETKGLARRAGILGRPMNAESPETLSIRRRI
jgi:uncharacterized protein YegP (UPF0339 family)